MNTYSKFIPNVFLAKCSEEHEKGEEITLITRRGKENKHIVFNLVKKDSEFFYYSIVRSDGFNAQEYAKKKAEKNRKIVSNAEKKSNEYYEKSNQHRDFLSLGEPIKIGHHSERRHRKIIEQAHNNMSKSVEFSKKAESYEGKIDYWESKTNDINLSMPESIEYFEYKLKQAKEKHAILKDNPEKRTHSFSLTYAKKEVNELTDKVKFAVKLWGDPEEIEQINKEEQEKAKKKASKKGNFEQLIEKYGGFWFFGSDVEKFKSEHKALIDKGYIEEGEKVTHIIAGLYVPVKNKDLFIAEMK
jgi:hypothetical protein